MVSRAPAVPFESREAAKILAQGRALGLEGPRPAFGTPLPHERERGKGGEGGSLNPRLDAVG